MPSRLSRRTLQRLLLPSLLLAAFLLYISTSDSSSTQTGGPIDPSRLQRSLRALAGSRAGDAVDTYIAAQGLVHPDASSVWPDWRKKLGYGYTKDVDKEDGSSSGADAATTDHRDAALKVVGGGAGGAGPLAAVETLGDEAPAHQVPGGVLLQKEQLRNKVEAAGRKKAGAPEVPPDELEFLDDMPNVDVVALPDVAGLAADEEEVVVLSEDDRPTADSYLEHIQAIASEEAMTVADAKLGCDWPAGVDVNFQFGSDRDWARHDRPDEEIARKQAEWHAFIQRDLIPWKDVAGRFEGRGIVVCAGNERSARRLQVLLRMLKHFGTALPVEVHYFGDEELSASSREELAGLYPRVLFADLSAPDNVYKTKHDNFYINYNVKLAALLNSRFAEPLLIDSDNVPVSDPSALFTSDTYRSFGSVFFPDIARTRPQNPMWAITNTPCRPDEYEVESGQLVVDKRRFWYHLQLAAFFGHDAYYQEFLLGDKDCFRFAWHALRTPYGRPSRWVTSIGYVARPAGLEAFPAADALSEDEEEDGGIGEARREDMRLQGGAHSFYCGHSFGQHHPDGVDAPLLFLHGGLVKTLNAEQIVHARKHAGGFFSAYKQSLRANIVSPLNLLLRDSCLQGARLRRRLKARQISSTPERASIKFDGGRAYLSAAQADALEHVGQCTDLADVTPASAGDDGTPELRGFEEAFAAAGGFWMLDPEKWTKLW